MAVGILKLVSVADIGSIIIIIIYISNIKVHLIIGRLIYDLSNCCVCVCNITIWNRAQNSITRFSVVYNSIYIYYVYLYENLCWAANLSNYKYLFGTLTTKEAWMIERGRTRKMAGIEPMPKIVSCRLIELHKIKLIYIYMYICQI